MPCVCATVTDALLGIDLLLIMRSRTSMIWLLAMGIAVAGCRGVPRSGRPPMEGSVFLSSATGGTGRVAYVMLDDPGDGLGGLHFPLPSDYGPSPPVLVSGDPRPAGEIAAALLEGGGTQFPDGPTTGCVNGGFFFRAIWRTQAGHDVTPRDRGGNLYFLLFDLCTAPSPDSDSTVLDIRQELTCMMTAIGEGTDRRDPEHTWVQRYHLSTSAGLTDRTVAFLIETHGGGCLVILFEREDSGPKKQKRPAHA